MLSKLSRLQIKKLKTKEGTNDNPLGNLYLGESRLNIRKLSGNTVHLDNKLSSVYPNRGYYLLWDHFDSVGYNEIKEVKPFEKRREETLKEPGTIHSPFQMMTCQTIVAWLPLVSVSWCQLSN